MEFQTLKQRIEALPEPERAARRALYSDSDWEGLWELNAYPHQIPPMDNDWKSWTVIGPPNSGKTWAGMAWVMEKFVTGTNPTTILALFHHQHAPGAAARFIHGQTVVKDAALTNLQSSPVLYSPVMGNKIIFDIQSNSQRHVASNIDYVWADEIASAPDIMAVFPFVKQFVFTNPAKLPANTRISRAGEPRAL